MHIKILAIGAHPDDVELGLGGCIAKHTNDRDFVSILIFSRGEKGVSDDMLENNEVMDEEPKNNLKGQKREYETKNALFHLGVKEENITIFGLPDTRIDDNNKIVDEIFKHVDKIKPDLIYTHNLEDDHLDHVSTSLISLHAARKIQKILLYESPSTRSTFSPNYFVDVSTFLKKKLDALKMHKTQIGKPYMEDDIILSKARFRGGQAKVKYAEAFVVYRMVEIKKEK
ncbi:MAG: PIG-L family deacetylase [Candidatus Methanoperedens sp.]|jgi:LmbE family N-acetylglucosaminyl deacetylase|nr:PIG-L family deacetylase [Candidatus Methanoperedens sp.]PKL52751.1 MAG: hypothetical protein CVV36_10840 [Candidatus Methanoperedenaceae archaeon HGW-Methanoperedenaceae-1]